MTENEFIEKLDPKVRGYFRELFLTTRLIQMNFQRPDDEPIEISMETVCVISSILHHFAKNESAPGPNDPLFLVGAIDKDSGKPMYEILKPLMDDIDRMAKFGEFEGADSSPETEPPAPPHLRAVPDPEPKESKEKS